MRLAVYGASGRMGRLVCEEAMRRPEVELVAAVSHGASDAIGKPSAPAEGSPPVEASYNGACDAVIDFSVEEGTRAAVECARRAKAALLVATTGLSDSTLAFIRDAAKEIPVLRAANTSLGVVVGRRLVEQAARLLGSEYDVDIVEAHHNRKRDAPSGTALAFAESVARGGIEIDESRYHSLRGGDVVGEHVIRFAGPGEYLEIRHVAVSRTLFAVGAVRAAGWLCGRSPGEYDIRDAFAPDTG
ncbi:MAG: 4-hydroxy-tetrahydrodipicolinate reductase [Phycisphaerales bacterium]